MSFRFAKFAQALIPTAAALAACAGRRAPEPPAVNEAEPAVRYLVESEPSVAVFPSGDWCLLLGAGPLENNPEKAALSVTYLASIDVADAHAAEAPDRIVTMSSELFEAFRVQAEAEGRPAVTVVATFGPPNKPGLVKRVTYVRSGGRWERRDLEEYGANHLPLAPPGADRATADEKAAAEVARGFVEDLDQRDFESAWAKTSAFIKAMTSRSEFDDSLQRVLIRRGKMTEPHELMWRYPAAGRLLPGSAILVRFAAKSDKSDAIEDVRLRLDDDLEWRVVGFGVAAGG